MLLTSLIISSSLANPNLADLSLVKSQAVEWAGDAHHSRQELNAELARFQDGYGRQFSVIRGLLASELGGDRFADRGYALCRYSKDGVLDRVSTSIFLDAWIQRQFTSTPLTSEGQLSEDTLTYLVKMGPQKGNRGLLNKLGGIQSMSPKFSLLEAMVLFDYKPNADPVYFLNTNLGGGQPAVIKFGFDQPEGDPRYLLVPLQPRLRPSNYITSGAVDRSGNLHFTSMISLFGAIFDPGQVDEGLALATNATVVRKVGELSPDSIAEMKKLVPDEWREKPKD